MKAFCNDRLYWMEAQPFSVGLVARGSSPYSPGAVDSGETSSNWKEAFARLAS